MCFGHNPFPRHFFLSAHHFQSSKSSFIYFPLLNEIIIKEIWACSHFLYTLFLHDFFSGQWMNSFNLFLNI